MAIKFKPLPVDFFDGPQFPSSLKSAWMQVNTLSLGTAPSITAFPLDAAFSSSGVLAGMQAFRREKGRGTTIRTRMLYDHAIGTVTAQFQYILLGRTVQPYLPATVIGQSTGFLQQTGWQVLPNIAGSLFGTLTIDAVNDFIVGTNSLPSGDITMQAANSSMSLCSHDCDGCEDFIILSKQALAYDGSFDLTVAQLQVKII